MQKPCEWWYGKRNDLLLIDFWFNLIFKWQSYTEITTFLEFTINDENPTLNLNVLCNSCAKISYSSSELIFTFLCAGSNIQYSIQQYVLCIHLPLVNFTLHPTSQKRKKNLKELSQKIRRDYLGNSSEPDTYSWNLCFPQWPTSSSPANSELSPRISV